MESVFSRNPDVVFRAIEGGGVLLDSRSGAYHEVNNTGRQIWEALEEPSTEDDLVRALALQFGEVPGLDADVHDFVTALTERKLLIASNR